MITPVTGSMHHNASVAKKTLIIDDLTGDAGARTRTLRFDGVEYEIDLTDASFAELRKALKPWPGSRALLAAGGGEILAVGTGRKAMAAPLAGRGGCCWANCWRSVSVSA